MAATKYSYPFDAFGTDYTPPTHKVNSDRLSEEIRASSIPVAFDFVGTADNVCDIWFKDALAGADIATLNGIVAAHTGEPIDGPPQVVRLLGPIDRPDDKAVVVVSPSRDGWMTWFTSRGDDTAAPPGRGGGPALDLIFSGPGEQTQDVQFTECVEIHDGEVWYTPVANWTPDDDLSVSVVLPATVPTPNPSATGNCNIVVTGGAYDVIVPAAGDGTHDVDLATAVPVPASGAGYWDCDYDTGVITASSEPGHAQYHLLTGGLEMFFLRHIACGHPLGSFEIDVYKAEWVHPTWSLRLSVKRATAGAGRITGWVMLFRPGAE
jgi:hypothetical protein